MQRFVVLALAALLCWGPAQAQTAAPAPAALNAEDVAAYVGGLVRAYVERKTHTSEESEVGAGTLFSSGLIAGGSLTGILYAALVGFGYIAAFQALGNAVPFLHEGVVGYVAGAVLFFALAAILARNAQKKVM